MIATGDMILIFDTSVVIKILTNRGGNIFESIKGWLVSILECAECNLNGRTIEMLVTPSIIDDYEAGFNKAKKRTVGLALSILFEKGAWQRIPVSSSNGIVFVVPYRFNDRQFTKASALGLKMKIRDKHDRCYWRALVAVLTFKRLSNRLILLAIDDRSTYVDIQRNLAFVHKNNRQRVELATSDDLPNKLTNH